MLKLRTENKAAEPQNAEAPPREPTATEAYVNAVAVMDLHEEEIRSLRTEVAQLDRVIGESYTVGATERERRVLHARRTELEERLGILERDLPLLQAAVDAARERKRAAEWDAEILEQQRLSARFGEAGKALEATARELAAAWDGYEAVFREHEALSDRARRKAHAEKREPFQRLSVEEATGVTGAFLYRVRTLHTAIAELDKHRTWKQERANRPPDPTPPRRLILRAGDAGREAGFRGQGSATY